jgi:hypothetical protein
MEPADVIPADLHVPVHGASSDRRGHGHLFQIRLLAPAAVVHRAGDAGGSAPHLQVGVQLWEHSSGGE